MFDFLVIYGKDNRPLDAALLDFFLRQPPRALTFAWKDAVYLLSERKDRLFLACSSDIRVNIARTEAEGGKQTVFFDGCLSQESFNTDIRALSPLVPHGAADHDEVFGKYCYGVFSGEGENHIHRDTLGMYPLFAAWNDTATVISNNPALAAQGIYGEAWRRHKNIYSLVNLALHGEIAGAQTSFTKVYSLPQNSGVLISADNKLSLYALIDTMYYAMSKDEWQARFESTYERLLHFTRTYVCDNMGGDITGGFDSRVFLSLLIKAGLHRGINWWVLGYDDHPDVTVAKAIAERFDMRLKMESVVLKDLSVMEKTFEKALGNYAGVAGMISFFDRWGDLIIQSCNTHDSKINERRITGQANEIFRGYYSLHHFLEQGIENRIITPEDYNHLARIKLNPEMFTDAAYGVLFSYYTQEFRTFEDLYSLDLIFTRIRNPQFHGGLSFKERPELCALGYNSSLHRLAMIQAPEERAACSLPFQIIERAAPELLYFPFADKKWHPIAYAHRADAARFLSIGPEISASPRPLPSCANFTAQARFLIESGFELDNALYPVCKEEYIESLQKDARAALREKDGGITRWNLMHFINLYGASLYFQNKEGAFEGGPCVPLSPDALSSVPALYTPRQGAFTEGLAAVLERGALFFAKDPVFRQSCHHTLSNGGLLVWNLSRASTEAAREHGRLRAELDGLRASKSWRLARLITFAPRKTRALFRCLKAHGVLWTAKHIARRVLRRR